MKQVVLIVKTFLLATAGNSFLQNFSVPCAYYLGQPNHLAHFSIVRSASSLRWAVRAPGQSYSWLCLSPPCSQPAHS